MNPIQNLVEENSEAIALEKAAQLQQQINQSLQQLSLERLQTVADFVAYLLDQESEAATQELMEIPGLLEKLQKQQENPSAYVNWRTIHSNV
jgi:Rad3-related DNA helicase